MIQLLLLPNENTFVGIANRNTKQISSITNEINFNKIRQNISLYFIIKNIELNINTHVMLRYIRNIRLNLQEKLSLIHTELHLIN